MNNSNGGQYRPIDYSTNSTNTTTTSTKTSRTENGTQKANVRSSNPTPVSSNTNGTTKARVRSNDPVYSITNDDVLLFNNTFGAESITEDQRNDFSYDENNVYENSNSNTNQKLVKIDKGNGQFEYVLRNVDDNGTIINAEVPSITQTDNGYAFNGTTYASQSLAQQAQDQWKADNNVTENIAQDDNEEELSKYNGLTEAESNELTYLIGIGAQDWSEDNAELYDDYDPVLVERYTQLIKKKAEYTAMQKVDSLATVMGSKTGDPIYQVRLEILSYESDYEDFVYNANSDADNIRYNKINNILIANPEYKLSVEEDQFMTEFLANRKEAKDKWEKEHKEEAKRYNDCCSDWDEVSNKYGFTEIEEGIMDAKLEESEDNFENEIKTISDATGKSEEEIEKLYLSGEYYNDDFVDISDFINRLDEETRSAFDSQCEQLQNTSDEINYYSSQLDSILGFGFFEMSPEEQVYTLKQLTYDDLVAVQSYYYLYNESANIYNSILDTNYGDGKTLKNLVSSLSNPYKEEYKDFANNFEKLSEYSQQMKLYNIGIYDHDTAPEAFVHAVGSGLNKAVGGPLGTLSLIGEGAYESLKDSDNPFAKLYCSTHEVNTNTANKTIGEANKLSSKMTMNKGTVRELWTSALSEQIRQLPMLIAGGELGLAGTFSSAFLSSVGLSDYENRQKYGDNLTYEQRLQLALTQGTIEGLAECLFSFGGMKGMGKFDLGNIGAKIASGVKSQFWQKIIIGAGRSGGEAIEEAISALANVFVDAKAKEKIEGKGTFGENVYDIFSSEEFYTDMFKSMAIAALSVMGTSAVSSGFNKLAGNRSGVEVMNSNAVFATQQISNAIENGMTRAEFKEFLINKADSVKIDEIDGYLEIYDEIANGGKGVQSMLRVLTSIYGADFDEMSIGTYEFNGDIFMQNIKRNSNSINLQQEGQSVSQSENTAEYFQHTENNNDPNSILDVNAQAETQTQTQTQNQTQVQAQTESTVQTQINEQQTISEAFSEVATRIDESYIGEMMDIAEQIDNGTITTQEVDGFAEVIEDIKNAAVEENAQLNNEIMQPNADIAAIQQRIEANETAIETCDNITEMVKEANANVDGNSQEQVGQINDNQSGNEGRVSEENRSLEQAEQREEVKTERTASEFVNDSNLTEEQSSSITEFNNSVVGENSETIRVVSKERMSEIAERNADKVNGFYDSETDTIVLNATKMGNIINYLTTVAHERTHMIITNLSNAEYKSLVLGVKDTFLSLSTEEQKSILDQMEEDGYFGEDGYGYSRERLELSLQNRTVAGKSDAFSNYVEEFVTFAVQGYFAPSINNAIINGIKGEAGTQIRNVVDSLRTALEKNNSNLAKQLAQVKNENKPVSEVAEEVPAVKNPNPIPNNEQRVNDFLERVRKQKEESDWVAAHAKGLTILNNAEYDTHATIADNSYARKVESSRRVLGESLELANQLLNSLTTDKRFSNASSRGAGKGYYIDVFSKAGYRMTASVSEDGLIVLINIYDTNGKAIFTHDEMDQKVNVEAKTPIYSFAAHIKRALDNARILPSEFFSENLAFSSGRTGSNISLELSEAYENHLETMDTLASINSLYAELDGKKNTAKTQEESDNAVKEIELLREQRQTAIDLKNTTYQSLLDQFKIDNNSKKFSLYGRGYRSFDELINYEREESGWGSKIRKTNPNSYRTAEAKENYKIRRREAYKEAKKLSEFNNADSKKFSLGGENYGVSNFESVERELDDNQGNESGRPSEELRKVSGMEREEESGRKSEFKSEEEVKEFFTNVSINMSQEASDHMYDLYSSYIVSMGVENSDLAHYKAITDTLTKYYGSINDSLYNALPSEFKEYADKLTDSLVANNTFTNKDAARYAATIYANREYSNYLAQKAHDIKSGTNDMNIEEYSKDRFFGSLQRKRFTKTVDTLTNGRSDSIVFTENLPWYIGGGHASDGTIFVNTDSIFLETDLYRTIAHESVHEETKSLSDEEYNRTISNIRDLVNNSSDEIKNYIYDFFEEYGYYESYEVTKEQVKDFIESNEYAAKDNKLSWMLEELLTFSIEGKLNTSFAEDLINSLEGSISEYAKQKVGELKSSLMEAAREDGLAYFEGHKFKHNMFKKGYRFSLTNNSENNNTDITIATEVARYIAESATDENSWWNAVVANPTQENIMNLINDALKFKTLANLDAQNVIDAIENKVVESAENDAAKKAIVERMSERFKRDSKFYENQMTEVRNHKVGNDEILTKTEAERVMEKDNAGHSLAECVVAPSKNYRSQSLAAACLNIGNYIMNNNCSPEEITALVDNEIIRLSQMGWQKEALDILQKDLYEAASKYAKSGTIESYRELLNAAEKYALKYANCQSRNAFKNFMFAGFEKARGGKTLSRLEKWVIGAQLDTRMTGIINMLDGFNSSEYTKYLEDMYYNAQARKFMVSSLQRNVLSTMSRHFEEMYQDYLYGFEDITLQNEKPISREEYIRNADINFQMYLQLKKMLGDKGFDWSRGVDMAVVIPQEAKWKKAYSVNEEAKPLNYEHITKEFAEGKVKEYEELYEFNTIADEYQSLMKQLYDYGNEISLITLGKTMGTGFSDFYTKTFWDMDEITRPDYISFADGSPRNVNVERINKGNPGDRGSLSTIYVPPASWVIGNYSNIMAKAVGEGQFYDFFRSIAEDKDNKFFSSLAKGIGKFNVTKIHMTAENMSGMYSGKGNGFFNDLFNKWQAGVLGGDFSIPKTPTGLFAYTTWMAQTFSTDTAIEYLTQSQINDIERTVTLGAFTRGSVQEMIDNIPYKFLREIAQQRLDGGYYEDYNMRSTDSNKQGIASEKDNLISFKDVATCAMICQKISESYSEEEATSIAVRAMDTQPNYDNISGGFYDALRRRYPLTKLITLFRNQRSTNATRYLTAWAKYRVNSTEENRIELQRTGNAIVKSTAKIALAKAIVNTLIKGWHRGDDDKDKTDVEGFAEYFAMQIAAQFISGIAANGILSNEIYNILAFALAGGTKSYWEKSKFQKTMSDMFGGYSSSMFPGALSTVVGTAGYAFNIFKLMFNGKENDLSDYSYSVINLANNIAQMFGFPASQIERTLSGITAFVTTHLEIAGYDVPDEWKTSSFTTLVKNGLEYAESGPNVTKDNMFVMSSEASNINAWSDLTARERKKMKKLGFTKETYNAWYNMLEDTNATEEQYIDFTKAADSNADGKVSKDEAEAFAENNPDYEWLAGDYLANNYKSGSGSLVTSSGYSSKQMDSAKKNGYDIDILAKYDIDKNGSLSTEEKENMSYEDQKALLGKSSLTNPETGMTDSEYAKWQKKGETWGLTTDAYIRIKALDKNGGGVSQDEMMQGIANGDVTVAEAWQYGLANGWSTKNMTKKFGNMPEGVSTTEQQRTISAVKPVELPNFNYNVDDLLIP